MSDHDPYGDPTRVDTPVSDPTMAMPASGGAPPPTGPPPTQEPPAEPPDRRPWILGALVVAILLIGLVLYLLSDDDDETSIDVVTTTTSSTTTSSSTTTTSAPPTTTTTATTTTLAPTPSTVDPARCVSTEEGDPDGTAQVVYEAYTLDDRACAGNLMTADAIDQLFDIPGAGGGWTFMGCEAMEDQTHCSFRFEGGSTTFRMAYGDDEGWTVYEVFQTAD